MSNYLAENTKNQSNWGVKDLISYGISFTTEYVNRYHRGIESGFSQTSASLEKMGQKSFEAADRIMRATHGLMRNAKNPKDLDAIETASKKMASAYATAGADKYIEAGRHFNKAMEAARVAKVAGGAGTAVTAVELMVQIDTAVKTGDWSEVGRSAAGLAGSAVFVFAVSVGIGLATAGVPIGVAAIAYAVATTVGDIAGKMAWDAFADDILDWLPDSFTQWFDIPNRTGQHYFYDPLVLDLDGDDTALAA